MTSCRVLLFCLVCLFAETAGGQSFQKCETLLGELLPEFNKALETRDLSVLKKVSYQKKLKKLKEAWADYHHTYFALSDSVARANNEAILLVLSGQYFRAALHLETVAGGAPVVGYHQGLISLLMGNFGQAAGLLRNNQEPNASLNTLVALGRAGKLHDALEFVANSSSPDNNGAWSYNSGVLYRKAGQEENAIRCFSNAIGKTDAAIYRISRGEVFLKMGSTKNAMADFSPLSRKYPRALFNQGLVHLETNEFLSAEQLFEDYLKTGDRTYLNEVNLGMANALFGQQRYAEARKFFQQVAGFRPLSVLGHCGVANVALSERKYLTARSIFDGLISKDTTFLQAFLGRAIARYGLGDFSGALLDFVKSDALIDPMQKPMADVLVCRGYSYYHTGDLKQAKQDFLKAVALDSARYEALAGLGKIEIDERRFGEAGKYLSAALRYKKDDDRLWANYGNLLLHFDMHDKAFKVFNSAARLNPANLNAQNGRGITLLEKDKLEASRSLFDSLLSTNPGKPFLLNNRGIVHAYRGNRFSQYPDEENADRSYKAAEKDFNLAMESAPAKRFYNVNKGNVFRYWEQYEDARLSYQSYQDKSALNNTAVLLAGQERLKDARYYMGVALQIDSTHRVFHYNMDVLARGKAKEMARFVASARDDGPYSDISIKYSLDGYVTIYLYDYEYQNMVFPGRHHLVLPYISFLSEDNLIPEYDFRFLPYAEMKKEPAAKRKAIRTPKLKSKGRSRSGTKCPVLF